MKERCDCLTKQLHTAESKCQNLQTTVERLSAALAKTEEGEEQLKERVNGLSKSVSNKQLVAQDLQDKVHKLQKLVTASEQDRTVLSERLENSRASIAELKKQMAKSNEKLSGMARSNEDGDLRQMELEAQLKTNKQMLDAARENESSAVERISKLQEEKKILQERVTGLQRAIAQLDAKKRETERAAQRLEKDKSLLKKSMSTLEKEKNARTEEALRLSSDRANLDSTVKGIEHELTALQKRNHELEGLLAETEQGHAHRILELTSRHRQEADAEMERLRSAHSQSERTLESRERSHRQRIRGLEEQITTLKDQLALEIRRKQAYLKEAVRSSS